MTTTDELPVWTVVRDMPETGDALVVVVRAIDADDARTVSAGREVEVLMIDAAGYIPNSYEPGWLATESDHIATFAGDLSAALQPNILDTHLVNTLTGEAK